MGTYNICFNADDNYTEQLGVAIISILRNSEKKEKFNFYVLDGEFSEESKKQLRSLSSIKSFTIDFIKMNPEDFKNCPLLKEYNLEFGHYHVPVSGYYRFKMPSIFSKLDKILYLDCDIVVTSSLKELYEIDIENYYSAMVPDVESENEAERLGLPVYCNAGVMLINLKKWRTDGIEKKLFKYAEKNKEKILWQDQDVLNVVLKDGIKTIPRKWNFQFFQYDSSRYKGLYEKYFDYKIIHYAGRFKPWTCEISHPLFQEYYDYLRLSPWKDKITEYKKKIFEKFILGDFSIDPHLTEKTKIEKFLEDKLTEGIHKLYESIGVSSVQEFSEKMYIAVENKQKIEEQQQKIEQQQQQIAQQQQQITENQQQTQEQWQKIQENQQKAQEYQHKIQENQQQIQEQWQRIEDNQLKLEGNQQQTQENQQQAQEQWERIEDNQRKLEENQQQTQENQKSIQANKQVLSDFFELQQKNVQDLTQQILKVEHELYKHAGKIEAELISKITNVEKNVAVEIEKVYEADTKVYKYIEETVVPKILKVEKDLYNYNNQRADETHKRIGEVEARIFELDKNTNDKFLGHIQRFEKDINKIEQAAKLDISEQKEFLNGLIQTKTDNLKSFFEEAVKTQFEALSKSYEDSLENQKNIYKDEINNHKEYQSTVFEDKMQNQKDWYENELKNQQQKFEVELKKQLNETHSSLNADFIKRQEEQKASYENSNNEIKSLYEEYLKEKQQKVEELQNKNSVVEEDVNRLENSIKECQNSISELEKVDLQKTREIETLRKEVQQKLNQIKSSEEEYQFNMETLTREYEEKIKPFSKIINFIEARKKSNKK